MTDFCVPQRYANVGRKKEDDKKRVSHKRSASVAKKIFLSFRRATRSRSARQNDKNGILAPSFQDGGGLGGVQASSKH